MPLLRRSRLAYGLVLTALAASCGVGSSGGPAGFCGWIGTDVEGLGRITAADGTTTVGTWYHVFAEGVADADNESRQAIADAVTADTQGFQQLRDQAPQDIQGALDRLYQLLQDPQASAERHSNPDVESDVVLINAQGCDFLRVEN